MLFKSLATIATVAFGALSAFAAPAVDGGLVERAAAQPIGVAAIFSNATDNFAPLAQKFQDVASQNLTIEALTPVATSIKLVFGTALDQLNRLQGQPKEIILAPIFPGGPLVTIAELAAIISKFLHIGINPFWFVYQLAYGKNIIAILNLISELGQILGQLIQLLFALVNPFWGNGALANAIRNLINDIAKLIISLQFQLLIKLLGL